MKINDILSDLSDATLFSRAAKDMRTVGGGAVSGLLNRAIRPPAHLCGVSGGRLGLPPQPARILLQEISGDVITGVGHDPEGFFAAVYDHGIDIERLRQC